MEIQMVVLVASPALMSGVLGPYVTAYCDYLRERRYAEPTRNTYLRCVAHFARWLAVERLELGVIDEQAGQRFIGSHLPHCDCTPPARRMTHEVRPPCPTFTLSLGRVARFRRRRPAMPGRSGRS
jgi:hypothetical protein